MSLDVYLRLRAAQQRRAVARVTVRHAHLATRPLVVVGYHLAGEPGAPVALMYGADPRSPRLVTVAEPRNRDQRFAALGEFARDLAAYLAGFAARESVEGKDGPVTVCIAAPQLVTPNTTTATWVTDLLGRSLRYLRTDGEYAVDPLLPTAGAHLTWLATRRVIPGSSTVIAATDLLATHWCTGQLAGEDENLGTLLAWIDPPAGADAAAAARAAEARPPAGPISDPAWDRDVLAPALGDAAAVRDVCEPVLASAWRDTWGALDLVSLFPAGAHVAQRWESDRRAWTRHLDRVGAGTAFFVRRLDQLQSFRFLAELEKRTVALDRQMALDDPLVMAGHVAAGDALAGRVASRDVTHRITLPSGRTGLRPLLRLEPTVPFERPLGTEMWWAANTGVRAQVMGLDDGEVTLMVVAGACRSAESAAAILPSVGADMLLAGFPGEDRYPDNLPDALPWTHVGGVAADDA